MKILKKVLLGLGILIVVLLIVAAILPKTYQSERQVTINKPKNEVFDYIKYVKNQDNFGVWQLSEPDLKKTYEGTDGTVGFKYSWDGKKLGKGSQTIVEIVEGEKMVTKLDFGFGEPPTAEFITKDAGAGQTTVIWGLSGKSPYPLNIMSLFFDVGDDFEKGLANLKTVLEKQ